jgi:ubiquinone/menaquinone biosynthesis C-methylase UbiE
MTIPTPIPWLLDWLGASPQRWNVLRRIVEDGFRGEKEVIIQELAPHQDDTRRFLDAGCGTGEFAPCFPPARYVGIDLSRVYLRFAGEAYGAPGGQAGARFAASDSTALALASASFDAALVLGLLHHLTDADARAALQELQRVLKPGAVALVMEDIPPPDWWNLAGHALHWIDRGGHIRSEADYRALFGVGFGLLRSYTMRSGICDYGVYVLVRQ